MGKDTPVAGMAEDPKLTATSSQVGHFHPEGVFVLWDCGNSLITNIGESGENVVTTAARDFSSIADRYRELFGVASTSFQRLFYSCSPPAEHWHISDPIHIQPACR